MLAKVLHKHHTLFQSHMLELRRCIVGTRVATCVHITYEIINIFGACMCYNKNNISHCLVVLICTLLCWSLVMVSLCYISLVDN